MAQSYVGKHAASKGIAGAYGSLWRLRLVPASWHVSGERSRSSIDERERRTACAAPDHDFSKFRLCSVFRQHAICPKTITWEIQKVRKLVQSCGGGRQPPAWVREGKEAARRRPLWQHATRRQGGARPVCLAQDWIGPTGDTTKQRFGSTKLKV